MYNYIYVIVMLFANAYAGPASFVTPCKANDNKCIESSAQAALPYIVKGIPELGLAPADPFTLNSINADKENLKLRFKNLTVYGANTCIISKVIRDVEKSSIKFDLECSLRGEGLYEIKGLLLLVEADGNGDFEIKADKIKFSIDAKIKDVEVKGKKYWKITGFDYKYKLLEKVHIGLKNLFEGDATKAAILHEVLDNSWREVVNEVGSPILKQILTSLLDFAKKFLLAVPSSELEIQ